MMNRMICRGKVGRTARRLATILAAVLALASAREGHAATAPAAADGRAVPMAPKVLVEGHDLHLNGAGVRRMYAFDVYAIGLYLSRRTASAEAAIDTYGTKRIAMTFLREVSAQSLVDALYEGIRDGSTEAEFARVKPYADALAQIMLPLRKAGKGETVALDYLPQRGSQVVVNGRAVGPPVPSHDLYRALMRIWLGEKPVDAGLKRALLTDRP